MLSLLATRRPEIIQPCNPSPCGINAQCTERGNAASCKCINDYTGNPYIECKPECVVNAECPLHLTCISQKCKDPCPGICGGNAKCYVTNHLPLCKCDPGFTGDAFVACQRITTCRFYILLIWILFNCKIFSAAKNIYRESRPLQSLSLWRECSLYNSWQCCLLSVHPGILRWSLCCLSTRVYNKRRMPS